MSIGLVLDISQRDGSILIYMEKLFLSIWSNFSIIQILENPCTKHHPHGIDTVRTRVNNPRKAFTLGRCSHER